MTQCKHLIINSYIAESKLNERVVWYCRKRFACESYTICFDSFIQVYIRLSDSNHAAVRGENVVDTEAEKAESKLSALLKSRRARRIAARMTKPKTRWGRLG